MSGTDIKIVDSNTLGHLPVNGNSSVIDHIAEQLSDTTKTDELDSEEGETILRFQIHRLFSAVSDVKFKDLIQIEHPERVEVYLGSKKNVAVQVRNLGSSWLRCSVAICRLEFEKRYLCRLKPEDVALVEGVGDIRIGPGQIAAQTITIIPQEEGEFNVHVLMNLKDVVTNEVERRPLIFGVKCNIPKIKMKVKGSDVEELDFGNIPSTCIERINVLLLHVSSPLFPLNVKIDVGEILSKNASKRVFISSYGTEDTDSLTLSYKSGTKAQCFSVGLRAPTYKDSCRGRTFRQPMAVLRISVEMSGGKTYLMKVMTIYARVGLPKLSMNFTSPVALYATETGASPSRTLSLKNEGTIPLSVELTVLDDDKAAAGTVLVNPNKLKIECGKEEKFDVIFVPSLSSEDEVIRKVVIQIQPDGRKFSFEVHGIMEDPKPPRVSDTCTRPVSTIQKQLVWTTLQEGTSKALSYRLQNNWPITAVFFIKLNDSSESFKLMNEQGVVVTEQPAALLPYERKTFHITFCPNKPGLACAQLIIYSNTCFASFDKFHIPLYGFCGTFNLTIEDIEEDLNGSMWLKLDLLDSIMEVKFTIKNEGNLAAFACVKYIPKGIGGLFQKSKLSIIPSRSVILPGTSVTFCVTLKFHEEDEVYMDYDTEQVLKIGSLSLVCGDEPTRHRIRRIRDNLTETSTWISEFDELSCSFLHETSILGLNLLEDLESHVWYLYKSFQHREIDLIIDRSKERSSTMQTPITNSENNISIVPEDNTCCANLTWSVKPSYLVLLIPSRTNGCFTIHNNHEDDQPFEVNNSVDFLDIVPQCGIVAGMGEAIVVVSCNTKHLKLRHYPRAILQVYFESDMKRVLIVTKPAEENSSR